MGQLFCEKKTLSDQHFCYVPVAPLTTPASHPAAISAWTRFVTLLCLLALGSAATHCTSSESHIGKTKSFLTECDDDTPCADRSLICACVCTVACTEITTCQDELARIGADVAPERIRCRAPSCELASDQAAAVAGVCDVSCEADEDCTALGAGHRCVGGFCRAEASVSEAAAGCPAGMRALGGVPGLAGPLCFDRYEVTVYDYARCIDDGVCSTPDSGNLFVEGREDHPIQSVSGEAAEQYCAWISHRLPTREEWSFAASNAQTTLYPWGNDPASPSDDPGRVCALDIMDTCPVGSRPAGSTSMELADLAGNVAELVRDDDTYCAAGGSYLASDTMPDLLASTSCQPFTDPAPDVGFRCVVEP